ncbi:MAG: DNRLRE domain-containing protein [Pseudomonadota bacterium]
MITRQQLSGFALIAILTLLAGVGALALLLIEITTPEIPLIEAGADTDNVRYALQAAESHARYSLQQNGACSGYTQIADARFNGVGYRVSISPNEGSPVRLDITAESDLGAQTQTHVDNVRVYAEPETLTIVSTPGDPDAEIEGSDGEETHNHWDQTHLDVEASATRDDRILMALDVPPLQRDLQIRSATLRLYIHRYGGVETEVYIRRLVAPWSESEADWTRRSDGVLGLFGEFWDQPGGDVTEQGASTLVVSSTGYIDVNLTDMVRDWQAGAPNYGFLINANPRKGGSKLEITTGQSSDTNRRPRLDIRYACQCGSPCAPSQHQNVGAVLTFEDGVTIDNDVYRAFDAVDFDASRQTAAAVLSGAGLITPSDAEIWAIHRINADRYLIAFGEEGGTVNGVAYDKNDIIEVEPSTGRNQRFWRLSNVRKESWFDGIHLRDDGQLAFTITFRDTVWGVRLESQDIALANPTTNVVTKWIDGRAITTQANEDFDALHVFENGLVVLSSESNDTVVGTDVTRDDLVLVDPTTLTSSLFYQNGSIGDAGGDLVNIQGITLSLDTTDPTIGTTLEDMIVQSRDCANDYRDSFLFPDYARNEGTLSFLGPWEEEEESDGPESGNVQILFDQDNSRLRIEDDEYGIERSVDLTSATNAFLWFDLRRVSVDDPDEYLLVEARPDGGSWVELDRFRGPATDAFYQSNRVDLSAVRSANTRIRFITSDDNGSGDFFYIDNVDIRLSGCPGP